MCDFRTFDLRIDPCAGCEDYVNGKCISNGGCLRNINMLKQLAQNKPEKESLETE